jgi:hypothetical protein
MDSWRGYKTLCSYENVYMHLLLAKGIMRTTGIICALLLLVSCSPLRNDSPVSALQERTALLSSDEQLCALYEQSTPFAFTEFAIREGGEIKYFRTVTTCDDFVNHTYAPPIFGERVMLTYNGAQPVSIKREDGREYRIEKTGTGIRSFFKSKLNPYESLREQNPRPAEMLQECRLLQDPSERSWCIAYQAAFQRNSSLCDEVSADDQETCRA